MRRAIEALSYADGVLWALLAQACSPGDPFATCAPELLRSTDRGQTWAPLPTPPSAGPQIFAFLRLDRGRAWLFGNRLQRTTDGGESWTTLSMPDGCDRRAAFPAYAAGTLWLACTDCHANGSECRAVYTSPDGGDSWMRAFPPDPFDPNAFTNGGTTSQLAAASAQTAVFCLAAGPAGGPLQSTLDGGQTWNWILRQPNAGCAGAQFIDDLHGWFADNNDSFGPALSAAVWQSVDGGRHWERHALP